MGCAYRWSIILLRSSVYPCQVYIFAHIMNVMWVTEREIEGFIILCREKRFSLIGYTRSQLHHRSFCGYKSHAASHSHLTQIIVSTVVYTLIYIHTLTHIHTNIHITNRERLLLQADSVCTDITEGCSSSPQCCLYSQIAEIHQISVSIHTIPQFFSIWMTMLRIQLKFNSLNSRKSPCIGFNSRLNSVTIVLSQL